jgi:hypothetical protein
VLIDGSAANVWHASRGSAPRRLNTSDCEARGSLETAGCGAGAVAAGAGRLSCGGPVGCWCWLIQRSRSASGGAALKLLRAASGFRLTFACDEPIVNHVELAMHCGRGWRVRRRFVGPRYEIGFAGFDRVVAGQNPAEFGGDGGAWEGFECGTEKLGL